MFLTAFFSPYKRGPFVIYHLTMRMRRSLGCQAFSYYLLVRARLQHVFFAHLFVNALTMYREYRKNSINDLVISILVFSIFFCSKWVFESQPNILQSRFLKDLTEPWGTSLAHKKTTPKTNVNVESKQIFSTKNLNYIVRDRINRYASISWHLTLKIVVSPSQWPKQIFIMEKTFSADHSSKHFVERFNMNFDEKAKK